MAAHATTQLQTPARVLVILPANRITLPEILRHIEAGKVVMIILPAAKKQPEQSTC